MRQPESIVVAWIEEQAAREPATSPAEARERILARLPERSQPVSWPRAVGIAASLAILAAGLGALVLTQPPVVPTTVERGLIVLQLSSGSTLTLTFKEGEFDDSELDPRGIDRPGGGRG